MFTNEEEKRQAFREDVETVYQMWKKSDLNTPQQSHLGQLMFNIVNKAKIMKNAADFYLDLRFILQVIPDLYNFEMQFYLSFLGRINDPYDYLEKDTLVQTYKTAIDNYNPVGYFAYVSEHVPVVDLSNQQKNTNVQQETVPIQEQCEDLTKRLRTGKIY